MNKIITWFKKSKLSTILAGSLRLYQGLSSYLDKSKDGSRLTRWAGSLIKKLKNYFMHSLCAKFILFFEGHEFLLTLDGSFVKRFILDAPSAALKNMPESSFKKTLKELSTDPWGSFILLVFYSSLFTVIFSIYFKKATVPSLLIAIAFLLLTLTIMKSRISWRAIEEKSFFMATLNKISNVRNLRKD